MTESLLVKNASFILTQNEKRDVLRNADILIEGSKISRIGKDLGKADKVINAKGKAVLPGLINCHTHLGMTFLRGYSDDKELHDWLEKDIWPIEAKMTDEHLRVGTLLGVMESIRFGTTTVNDMYAPKNPPEYESAKVLHEVGFRGVMGWGLIQKSPEDSPDRVKPYLKEWSKKSEFVTPAIAPHAIYTCDSEFYLKCKDLAEKFHAPLHTHLSETRKEVADCYKEHGKRPVQHLNDSGFLDSTSPIIAAHCGWLSKQEIKVLGEKKIGVSHNPLSNMKLAVGGVMDLIEMQSQNIAVGLGTDSTASNNNLDLFEEMKVAALIQKHFRWNPLIADSQTILDLATIEGARAIGMHEEIGSIEVGKKADLALIDLDKAHLQPVHTTDSLKSNLVYAANGNDVSHTVINGRVLLEDGRFTTLDWSDLRADVEKLKNDLF